MDQRKTKTKELEKISWVFAKIAAASLLMMWGVVNLVFNVLSFRRLDADAMPDSMSMSIAVLLIILTGAIPFLIGLIWLWSIMGKAPKK